MLALLLLDSDKRLLLSGKDTYESEQFSLSG